MIEQNTSKMTHDEMIDVLKGLVFGTFDRTTAKEREALNMAISDLSTPSANVISIDQANAIIKSYVSHYEENKGEWIPVSERLPKPYVQVLRTVKFIGWNGTSYIDVDLGTICPIDTNVIAWMPLPEPYKAESENNE